MKYITALTEDNKNVKYKKIKMCINIEKVQYLKFYIYNEAYVSKTVHVYIHFAHFSFSSC